MIPHILHFVWIGSELPAWAERNIDEFLSLNPGIEYHIHDESVLLPELRTAYESTPHLCGKADLLRLSALRQFGGWYFDVDYWPLRSLDSAAEAWGLDGQRLFLSRQQGHKAGDRLPYANAPMAAAADSPGLQLLIDMVRQRKASSRQAFGPELVRDAIGRRPDLYEISEAGWWFPFDIRQSSDAYGWLLTDPGRLALRTPATSGQVPYAAHLWAGAIDIAAAAARSGDVRRLAIVQAWNRTWPVLDSVANGLTACGMRVERVHEPDHVRTCVIRPDLVVVWNGLRDTSWADAAKAVGARMLYIEHGFFARDQYAQVDHEGFLHRASWRQYLRDPAPAGGAERLAQHVQVGPMRPRSEGYVLVLGQVNGDTQLLDSEIEGPAPLQRFVSRALPEGVPAFFRAHPQMRRNPTRIHHNLPWMPVGEEHAAYAKTKQGSGLAAALKGARFVIAINSNGLNEALAAGVPAMAFGPFLGIDAGAVRGTTAATIKDDMRAMLEGWAPQQAVVDRYLQWLAARQWSPDELCRPDVIHPLLEAAGLHHQVEHLQEA